jgi:chlorobactene glucosyltransferase
MLSVPIAAALAAPWWATPLLLAWRTRTTPTLEQVPDTAPADAPLVSIILPARNEAVHIGDCVGSILRSTWPNLELIVIDDHSTDGTGDLARAAGAGDPRLTVLQAPDMPDGWFGKQWACWTGQQTARGSLLLFTDADTRHAPDLVARMVRMRELRGAELFSVAGRQEMVTIWEKAVQPSVFTLIFARYGGAEQLERAAHPREVVANGQCFLLSRAMYDRIDGHAAVRAFVAEDLMLAQAVVRAGGRVSMALGVRQLRTRMYDGLPSLMKGWRKNLYAGGRHAMWGGALARRFVYPLLLLSFPLLLLTPFAILAWGLATGGAASITFGVVSGGALLAAFAISNVLNGDAAWRAIYAPLGGAILLVIVLQAIVRGDRVEWKGRAYHSA